MNVDIDKVIEEVTHQTQRFGAIVSQGAWVLEDTNQRAFPNTLREYKNQYQLLGVWSHILELAHAVKNGRV